MPILIITLGIMVVGKSFDLGLWLSQSTNKVVKQISLSPPFKILNLSIINDDPDVVEKISSTLALRFPLSSLDLNVENLRSQVESIKLVESASVRLTSNGLIEISVKVRKPVAMHLIRKRFILIDASGVEIDEVDDRSQRLDLPLLVGRGAEHFVHEAIFLLLETKTLITRIRGLVRIGERRWNIVLDRDQIIYLPEDYPLKAIKKLVSLHEGRRILDRNISYLDLRNINRPIVGLTEETSKELRDIRNLVRGENV